MTNAKLPSYIVPYGERKKFCRKIRDTEKEIQRLKNKKKWKEAAQLGYTLRNSWWGYKRYSQ
tara:strand:+ start:1078 stop:1263 length:186 start_codon:yes stop_codon:yes gene_type:complete